MSTFIEPFIGTLLIIMLAEFGDKTHLIVLSLMSKTLKPYHVAFGGFLGITSVTVFGVIIGTFLGQSLPINLISIIAGLIFIVLGVLTLIENDEEDQNKDEIVENNNAGRVILRSILLVSIGELGDKSQIFVITASAASNPYAILLGASIGMGIIFILTAFIGERLVQLINPEILNKISGLLFIVAGLWLMITVFY